jgi:putative phage-type endonuclease
MIIHNCEQGSEEWKKIRIGKVTMSRASDILAKGVGSAPSKTRQGYLYEIASEVLTGQMKDSYTNAAMEYGTLTEPLARAAYQQSETVDVQQVGFVEHGDFHGVGCSPDGILGDDGLLEIKCPNTSTQIQRVLSGEFPSEYQAQVQGQLWVCQREWCDFLSYDGRIKGPASYFKVRVYRDEEFIKKLTAAVDLFIVELNEILEKVKRVSYSI